MKNKENILGNFKKKLLIKILISIILISVVVILIVFICDTLLNGSIGNIANVISPRLYSYWVQNKLEVIIITIMLFVLISTSYIVSKTFKAFEKVISSIDAVFKKNENIIELSEEFKEVENKLNNIKFEIVRNEKIAKEAEQRKNDLVVYLAHDLKTPLTSVIGYLTLLNESKDLPKGQREKYIGISLEKAERLELLINEFFDITRFNLQNIELEKRKINLSLMLDQIIDEFYPLFIKKNIECKRVFDKNIEIYADSDKLARVFDNIIRNAINYSYDDSEITVIIGAKDKEKINIRFRNNGNAIPDQKLKNIFEKFYRLDEARSSNTGGAGLGLAIANEIVKLHNGEITAISNKEYTEFKICIPLQT